MDCRLSEQGVQEVFKTELGERDRGRCLELDPTICELPEVRRFRERLGFSDETTDEEKARAIYRDLVDNKRFKKTKDCTQNPKYSTAVVLSNTGGHCRTLARAIASPVPGGGDSHTRSQRGIDRISRRPGPLRKSQLLSADLWSHVD